MRIITLLFLVGSIGCSGDDSDVTSTPVQDGTEMDGQTAGANGKADDADGVQLTDEFCEWVSEESDGYCLEQCRDFDADCEGVEPPVEDQCAVRQLGGDDICDEACPNADPDCQEPADLCFDEIRYGDGACDEDCLYADPDCKDAYEDTGELTSEERRICSGFDDIERDLMHDFASTICMERSGQLRVDCIEACLEQSLSP